MQKKLSNIVFGIALLAAIGFFYYKIIIVPTDLEEQELAPLFECPEGVGLKELQGNYVLLDFWGSWCGPCRRENEEWVGVYQAFEGKKDAQGRSFYILNVALERNRNSWLHAIEKDHLYWSTHCLDLDRMSSSIARKYDVREIPTNFLILPDRRIHKINIEPLQLRQFLSEVLTK